MKVRLLRSDVTLAVPDRIRANLPVPIYRFGILIRYWLTIFQAKRFSSVANPIAILAGIRLPYEMRNDCESKQSFVGEGRLY